MANEVKQSNLHRIVLSAVIYRDDTFLITKRSPTQKVHPGKWALPGGGVETEDYIDSPKSTDTAWYGILYKTLRREVKEEVNLEIGDPQYLRDIIFIRPDNIPVLLLTYCAPYVSGEVVLEEGDATEYAWVTLEESKNYDLIPGVREDLQLADTIRKSQTI